jgi:protein required for attachment to host cells
MTTTWVVVAHQTGARILEHRSGFGRNLTFVSELENPDGRKRNHEIDSDRAGQSFSRAGGAASPHAMNREHTAHEHVIEGFIRTIAEQLQRARAQGSFDDLILVAEPRFLGGLRGALDAPTAHKVVASVTKDLAAVPSAGIAKHVADVLPL